MITHWTFMHSVSTVNKSYFTINHVWESLKFMHLSSCKVQTVVKLFHLYKEVIATRWVYIATGQLHSAPRWMYIATGQLHSASGWMYIATRQLHSAPRWMYDLMSNKYITLMFICVKLFIFMNNVRLKYVSLIIKTMFLSCI